MFGSMQCIYKLVFALYLLILLWLVLFKFSFDFSSVLDYHIRSLTLIPFSGAFDRSVGAGLREIIYNIVVFIPFGLLLSVNLKGITAWRKLAFVFVFSVAAEIIQFVLAIGRADITDVIMNTLGGFIGLALYGLGKKYVDSKKLDWFIVMTSAALLMLFILLRLFVFKVSYQSAH